MATQVVIETTRTAVRLAAAETHAGQLRLIALDHHPIASPAENASRLAAWLKALKRGSVQAMGVIPREQVIVRVVKFPSTQQSELAQMVELYAKAQLPYPREQTVMDFYVLTQEAGFTTVAIVACQREAIDRQLAVLRQAGLSASAVTVSSWGVLGWYQRAARLASAGEPALVVNVDETRTDLVLIGTGRILSTRSVGQGAADWGSSAEVVELLTSEVDRSRAAVRKELVGIEIRSLLLTGLGEPAHWQEPLSQRLGLPVVVLPAEPSLAGAAPASAAAISPVVVGGLALSPWRDLPNLNPPEARVGLRHRQQVKELVTTSLLVAGLLVLAAGLVGMQIARQQRLAAQLDGVLTDVGPKAKQLQEAVRTAQLVEAVLADRRHLAQLVSGVFRITPASIVLEVLTFERPRGELTVRGSAGSTQDVLGYIQQLQSLEGIDGVDLKFSTRRATAAGERTDFELLMADRR